MMIPLMGDSVDVGSVTYAFRPCKVVTVPLGVASSCTWPLKQSGHDMMINIYLYDVVVVEVCVRFCYGLSRYELNSY